MHLRTNVLLHIRIANIFFSLVWSILIHVHVEPIHDVETVVFCICLQLTANEPRHEISNNMVYATSKDSDQPAHMRSLIRAFASRLDIL